MEYDLTMLRDVVAAQDHDGAQGWLRGSLDHHERAEALAELSEEETVALAQLLAPRAFAHLLGSLEPHDAAEVLDRLTVTDAAEVLEVLEPDKAVDIARASGKDRLASMVAAMEPLEAAELQDLLSWPPDLAGGRMTPAFVAVAPQMRADEAVAALRRVAAEAETITYVYVTGANDDLLGVLSLRNLVLSPPQTPVAELMDTTLVSVSPTTHQEEAARLLNDHELIALPVVRDGRLLGIITSDDVADIIEEETTEDFDRLGGSEPLDIPYLRASPALLWRKRVIWLLALFAAEAYTGTVMRHFEDELNAVVALAFFVPLLIGTGGNVGSQIVTTLVRAMALGGVRLSHVLRVVRKELATGSMLAAVLAAAAFLRAVMLGVGYQVAIVVTLSISAIVLWASLIGAVLPLVLRRLKLDPAVVSAPFITTLVDGTGLLIYFTIARLVL